MMDTAITTTMGLVMVTDMDMAIDTEIDTDLGTDIVTVMAGL
jgi:hypothetical protein